ncbi:acetyltransferase [Murimonas intestini]|uniref:Acetyltransferase n=1 Tax=Murimonas intestini TaxID=1337051 RepID=A0AB73T4Z0_9FIRM|nr:acetyltransferase [Murimonas intestini]MCR1840866.1 acetyltransferase [Murimonas intestini]MCR1866015.1 acetyltransferase [Murimonas intestini]MCR1883435.1 acetyltransferase [Murimonas intestini]
MKLAEVENRDLSLISELLKIWEASVRITHSFLSEAEIKNIAEYLPHALNSVPHLIAALNMENNPVGFMGIEGRKLEMLFISPEEMGKGIGRQLILWAMENYAVNEVDVNEQNPQARGFYEHMGFHVFARSETDGQGNPYPILHMRYVQDSGRRMIRQANNTQEGI